MLESAHHLKRQRCPPAERAGGFQVAYLFTAQAMMLIQAQDWGTRYPKV